jgi:hypothetical protein
MVSSISKNMRLGEGALLLSAKLVFHLLMEGLVAIPKNR